MPALFEMTLFGGDRWADDSYNTWLDCDYNVWLDSDLVVNASHIGYAGAKYWDQYVLSLTSPQFRIDHSSGGHCKLGFGDVTLSLDTFEIASIWPPPESCPCVISYADDNDTITELFSGTMHRQKLSRDGVVYQFYERTFDQLLLVEEADYDGNVVPLPRAFGAVIHQQPVRLADAGGGNRRYSAGSLQGTKHTDWHVYDDGVDVCSNANAISSNVFEYTVTPVGEITISGTGEDSTLINIFDWACASGRLSLSFGSSLAGAFTVSHWAKSQETLVSFLDRLAAYASHIFYIKDDNLELVSMASDNGTLALTEFDFFPSSITFARPVALVKTNWTDRSAVEETIGKYIKETTQEVSVTGLHPYGNEESVDSFQTTKADVITSLESIHEYMTSARWETSMPLVATFPLPGLKITALDNSMGQSVSISIHARDIEYDFENQEVRISGEGSIA